MSTPRYSVLTLFASPRGHLAEISRTTPRSQDTWVTEWLWIELRHVVTLQVLDRDGVLAFDEGRLHVGEHGAALHWSSGRTDALTRVDDNALPPAARSFLELHLS